MDYVKSEVFRLNIATHILDGKPTLNCQIIFFLAKEMKEQKLKEEEELKKKLKRQESKERVTMWMKSSTLKPKPVPSSMGLLSRLK